MGNQTATALPAALLVALAIHTAALTSQLHRTPRDTACAHHATRSPLSSLPVRVPSRGSRASPSGSTQLACVARCVMEGIAMLDMPVQCSRRTLQRVAGTHALTHVL